MNSKSLQSIHLYLNKLIHNYFAPILLCEKINNEYWDIEITGESVYEFEKMTHSLTRKYYEDIGGSKFNPLNSDHMSMLLYLVSKKISRIENQTSLADGVSYLNKIMHGIDIWHNVELPKEFFFIHPVGTVLGRAEYGDFLIVYQGVTIGSSKNIYPKFKGSTILYSNSSVLGNSIIGDNTIIGAGAFIIDENIPDNTQSKGLVSGNFQIHQKNIKEQFYRGEL